MPPAIWPVRAAYRRVESTSQTVQFVAALRPRLTKVKSRWLTTLRSYTKALTWPDPWVQTTRAQTIAHQGDQNERNFANAAITSPQTAKDWSPVDFGEQPPMAASCQTGKGEISVVIFLAPTNGFPRLA